MAIVSTGRTISTEEFYRRKQKERRTKLLVALGGVLVIFGTLVFLSRLERFRISAVAVEGAKVVSADDVEEVVREILSGYYFFLVPKNNTFVYPENYLRDELYKRFPRFNSVDITLGSFKQLTIAVSERKPYALYCGAQTSSALSEVCYFLDEVGFIFDTAPSFSDGVYFVYATERPFDNPRGAELLPQAEFENLQAFLENLPELNIDPSAAKVFDDYFLILFAGDAQLLVPRGFDLSAIYSNLESFLSAEEIKAEADFLERVRELDLRTEDKVFYSFRNEE